MTSLGVKWRLPHTLTLLPTYKCTAACKECCFQSNPRIKERVPQQRLLDYIDQASKLETIKIVCVSGGEPFVLGDDLIEIVSRASCRGFITRIVSNGFWARSESAAKKKLEPLVEAGLNEINFSTGEDHIKFVPLSAVAQAIDCSLKVGLSVSLMIEAKKHRRISKDSFLKYLEKQGFSKVISAEIEGRLNIIESPWMDFSPTSSAVEHDESKLANAENLHKRGSCTSVLSTIVIPPSEKLGMCCGLPREHIPDLTGGNLRHETISVVVSRARYDFIKMWLFVEGPERILSWASSKDSSIEWENKYAHNCDACRAMYSDVRVMKVIEKHFEEKYEEIIHLFALYNLDVSNNNDVNSLSYA